MRAHSLVALVSLFIVSPIFAAGSSSGTTGPAPVAVAKPVKGKEIPLKALPILSDEQKKTVDLAINDLCSEEFEVRERASKQILDLGPGAIPQLEVTLKVSDDDAERQERAKKLVDELKAKHRGGPTSDQIQVALTHMVSFEFVDMPVKACLERLCEQVDLPKNAILAEPDFEDVAISLRVSDMQLGMALQWLSRLAEAEVEVAEDKIMLVKKKL